MNLSLRPGEHFFGVRCGGCEEPVPFAKDPSNGTKPINFQGPGKLKLPCPKCGHAEDYATTQIEHFRFITLESG